MFRLGNIPSKRSLPAEDDELGESTHKKRKERLSEPEDEKEDNLEIEDKKAVQGVSTMYLKFFYIYRVLYR